MSSPFSNPKTRVYLTIKEGNIRVPVQAPTENSKSYTSSTGKVYLYEPYKEMTGIISGLGTRERESVDGKKYMEQWVDLTFDGVTYQLQFSTKTSYFRMFAQQLENCDLSKPVTISVNEKIEGTKKLGSLFISQDGKNVGFRYTKSDPGSAPEIEAVKNKKGEIVSWDSEERDAFMINVVNTVCAEKLMGKAAAAMVTSENPFADDEPEFNEPESLGGDLPF